jgi:hypothetical protein
MCGKTPMCRAISGPVRGSRRDQLKQAWIQGCDRDGRVRIKADDSVDTFTWLPQGLDENKEKRFSKTKQISSSQTRSMLVAS